MGKRHLDPLGEETSSIFLLHTRNHHAAPTSLPVNRRGHLASGGELEAVNHSEDFVEVSSCWRKFSVKLIRFCQKPVVAGYRRDSFSLLSGPMMNTALRGMDVETLEENCQHGQAKGGKRYAEETTCR